jgi:hypothetical protein
MITKPTIKALIKKRLDDARILLKNRRYSSTIYMSGYALELALKYRICRIMKFSKGFPENRAEFDIYYFDTTKTFLRSTIKELRDIRHHKLPILLRYSGEQLNIETNFSSDWDLVKGWNPEMRYINMIVRRQKANDFLKSIRSIVNELL